MIIADATLFERTEVLVIIDGSPDHSIDIACEYEKKYSSVFKVIEKDNGGHGSVINMGAQMASGRFFKVLDADDWFNEEEYEKYLQTLETIEADVIFSPYYLFDIREGKYELVGENAITEDGNSDFNEVMKCWDEFRNTANFWGITYNTDFYRKLDYKVTENVFYEDLEYSTVPASFAKKIKFSENPIYCYRVGDVNQSVNSKVQVERHSHLEKVIESLLLASVKQPLMLNGGDNYYRHKTCEAITSFYQIALVKNPNKSSGRHWTESINANIKKNSPEIYSLVQKKYKMFLLMSYLHVSNDFYEYILIKMVHRLRKMNK